MRTLKILSIGFVFLLLISCRSTLTIVADHDVTVDFSAHKTYMYLPWNKDNSEYITLAAQKRLYGLLDEQFIARGYTKVDKDADLAVNLMALLDEKTATTRYTRYYSTGGYGYYSPFGYGFESTTYYKKTDILEGSIIVDVFDQSTKTLIWQGVAILEIVENDSKREREVNNSIKKMFVAYPKKK